jgi:hypothetical protein
MASAGTLGRFVEIVEQATLKIQGTSELLFSLPGDSRALVYLQDEGEDDDSKLIPVAPHFQSSDAGFSFAISLRNIFGFREKRLVSQIASRLTDCPLPPSQTLFPLSLLHLETSLGF